ncbi:MAG: bifunctional alpha,alpha-trehalose-phosphate synthase (UDP-forming)/trehalose-phosphatase [Desulfobacterales bacterium]|nr:bifunctional alpha,alpha-trehalose-phosphate synthase (UDP-forming)/trehalose-phosphatase [Desulfobacterales bacterium]
MNTIVNVSNRLPVTIGKTIQRSTGGLVGAMDGLADRYALKWIGWAGGVVAEAKERRRLTRQLAQRFQFLPIFLDPETAEGYYTGFSNSSLWPLLHYIPTYARFNERWFDDYLKVNHIFADAVVAQAGDEDIIWVHDYHLMLLPGILRERRPELKTGFFLHTPFPSYEIFRCHPNRRELVEGMLGADLIGFHTFGYLRHFRSTVLRILGIASELNNIPHETHSTRIGVYPIGINTDKFLAELQSEAFKTHLAEYRQTYTGRKVVLSVERLDYTKGIPQRLEAIERFLEQTRREDVVFIFISIPTRQNVQAYKDLLQKVELKVSRINGKYATIENAPVHFIFRPVSFSELCALYALADVATVTPLIDGMNLVAKEYIVCQQEKSGVLILSEFAGAAQELNNACIVNPYNISEITDSLTEALSFSEEEKQKMIAPMRQRALQYNASHWAASFLKDLSAARSSEAVMLDTRDLSADVVVGIIGHQHAALFLDYDGTLAELRRFPGDAAPDQGIRDLLGRLNALENVDVYLVSGRKREDLDRWFSSCGLHLVAEHGYYHRMRGDSDWTVFDSQTDLSWKELVADILQHYTEQTPGTFMEEKTSSLVWHYRNADPEFGGWKAHQLVSELFEVLSNMPVVIHHGKKIVEISSIRINKGSVVEHFMQANEYAAALCAGDDETDESMFRLADERIVSIKVGETNDTAALYRVPSPRVFKRVLLSALEAPAAEKSP